MPAKRCYVEGVWARIHKIDKVRPQANGGAIVLVEDERSAPQIGRVPPLTTLIGIARVLNARRVLEAKYGGKGEVRYACNASLPGFLYDAVTRAGAGVSDRSGDKLIAPAQPASVEALIDVAFLELAHHTRSNIGVADMPAALKTVEANRRKSPLDKDAQPLLYWPAVFELAAIAGELARPRGGRWIETKDMPVPFAIRLASNELAMPTKLAQRIVEGDPLDESLADTV